MDGIIFIDSGIKFNSRGVKADAKILDWLDELPLPAILHWQGNH